MKHLVLTEVLAYMVQKPTPFEYVDTHSGAGAFQLDAPETQKLKEYKDGIGATYASELPGLARYNAVVQASNPTEALTVYPGSPVIALHFMRPQDRAWLCELHPADFERLSNHVRGRKRVRVFHEDGLAKLQALMPPASRRAVVLVDPSYEVKTEYVDVVKAIANAYRKFATGVYLLWYPVVDRTRIDALERQIVASGMRNVQRFELGVAPDSVDRGMTASGVIVVNPPWTLFDTVSSVLPELAAKLGVAQQPHYRCDQLVPE